MLSVASLFAGCGGSSLGYRAAGLDVRYACELDPVAREAYALNAAGHIKLGRDVLDHDLVGAQIVAACGGGVPDVVDGSPPCQDFTFIGRRDLEGENAALYWEFVRLVGKVRPRAFAAENVVGFARGAMRGRYFLPIVAALRDHGCAVQSRTLDASWLGVPQARKRVVLIGIHKDMGALPADAFPRRQLVRSAIRDALPGVARVVAVPGRHYGGFHAERTSPASGPAPTVTCSGIAKYDRRDLRVETIEGELRPLTIDDVKALCGFPADFRLPAGISEARAWKLLGNPVPPPMASAWAGSLARILAASG